MGAIDIKGSIARPFEHVKNVFASNFERVDGFRELGASIAVFQHGKCVADLWAGFKDAARATAWQHDTLVNVWSTSKGMTATAVAMLVDRGTFAYDDRVGSIWPEFEDNGKEATTIGHLMSHQAGLPGFCEKTSWEDQFDWQGCCEKLARQAPLWEPGTATSYHAMTFGWLAGEIVRRATGKSLGRFLRDEIAAPLAADILIGLPIEQEPNVAEVVSPLGPPAAMPELAPAARMALENPVQDLLAPNKRVWRAAEIPSANGHASAMGLARLYAALIGSEGFEGVNLLSPRGLQALRTPATRSGRTDLLMGTTDAWAMGMMLNPASIYGANPHAFGHSGWGGSFGCADPELGLSVGYVCNQMGSEIMIDPRAVALCQAAIDCATGREAH